MLKRFFLCLVETTRYGQDVVSTRQMRQLNTLTRQLKLAVINIASLRDDKKRLKICVDTVVFKSCYTKVKVVFGFQNATV